MFPKTNKMMLPSSALAAGLTVEDSRLTTSPGPGILHQHVAESERHVVKAQIKGTSSREKMMPHGVSRSRRRPTRVLFSETPDLAMIKAVITIAARLVAQGDPLTAVFDVRREYLLAEEQRDTFVELAACVPAC